MIIKQECQHSSRDAQKNNRIKGLKLQKHQVDFLNNLIQPHKITTTT